MVQEMALRFQDIHSPPLSLILLDGSKNILKVPEDIRSNRVTVPTPVKLFLAGMGLDVDVSMVSPGAGFLSLTFKTV